MSFASEVKKEILTIDDIAPCCKKALLFGLLQASSKIAITNNKIKIIIKMPLLNAIKVIIPILKEQYGIIIEEGLQTTKTTLGHKYYYFEVKDKVDEIIKDYMLMPYEEINIDNSYLKNECCKGAFVRGLFAAKGSINDPRKECYHFEINLKKDSVAYVVKEILASKGIESKIISKGQNYVLYVKKSENISGCLALIGASSGVFYFEDQRIYRDYWNQANRLTNCDVANARKSAAACEKQLEIIKKIRSHGYFNKMPLRLQLIAIMREDYPDSPLEELSEYSDKVFGKRLSKSGISHCMRDLISYYETLKIED